MSEKSIGPEEKKRLEVYVKCLRRAERRIIMGGQMANGRPVDLTNFPFQRYMIEHIKRCIKSRGVLAHGQALMRLQIKRSRIAAQLEGLTWQ